MGELAETTSLLRMRSRKITESSNLSLSATSNQFLHLQFLNTIIVRILAILLRVIARKPLGFRGNPQPCKIKFIRARFLHYRLPQPWTKASQ